MEDSPCFSGFLGLAVRRRSVRRYAAKPVAREVIARCLEAARLAPSACNAQPWTFVAVDDPALRAELAAAAGGGLPGMNAFVRGAPVIVAVILEKTNVPARFGSAVKGKAFPLMDIGIAAEHFCLQAAEEGLGACLIGWFDEARVRRLLGIPRPARPALLIAAGYPENAPDRPKKRKPAGEMSAWNEYPSAGGRRGATAGSGWGLAGWLALTFAAAAAGGAATARAGPFYESLARPAWAPPAGVFGPVWTALYLMMALAAWLVWRERGFHGARLALGLFLAQLAINSLWSWLFFAWRLGAAAFAGVLALGALVSATAVLFARIRKPAAWLLAPYLAWLAYAAALAFSAWRRNPDLLG